MITINGKGIFGGIAIGKLSVYKRRKNIVARCHIDDVSSEILRFNIAKEKALEQLKELYSKAVCEIGEADAMIFEIHRMMLNDPNYSDSIEKMIVEQSVNAEYAVSKIAEDCALVFFTMEDNYMKERASDVKDVSERLLNILLNTSDDIIIGNEQVIIAAEDLVPSETVQLDKKKVLGFVTVHGSSNSHTAILARTMNIPAVINAGDNLKVEYDGLYAIVDGFSGTVYIDPDRETIELMIEKQAEALAQKDLLLQLKGEKNITLDGKEIDINANIGNLSDIENALRNDAGGIGLFRSEFLYFESLDFPTEEQQFEIYKIAVKKMEGKKLVIRTLDVGADKQADYFNLPKEENPALGFRGIRISLEHRDIFKTQLRALYRASVFGTLSIMFPMITSLSEVYEIKKIISEVKNELKAENIQFDENVKLGIMIETPAAVMISDILAKEVDFFSIGTNDLIQYVMAIDRQNPKLDKIYNLHNNKAILKMIKMTVENAHKNNIPVGICGELAADLTMTEIFLSIGVDELSVSPFYVLGLRKKVIETNVSKIKDNILSELN